MVFSNVMNGNWVGTWIQPLGLESKDFFTTITILAINSLRLGLFSTFIAETVAISQGSEAFCLIPSTLIHQHHLATASAMIEVSILIFSLADTFFNAVNPKRLVKVAPEMPAIKEGVYGAGVKELDEFFEEKFAPGSSTFDTDQ